MKRLFTFGCSYTKYIWPTWADFLSVEFDEYQNWGLPGIGCRGISERVAECHARNNFTPDDTIIIQWTTHLRHDFYHPKPTTKRIPGWQTAGSIFSNFNWGILYDEEWTDTFFNEAAYIMHCFNHMILVQSLLKSTGAKWYMTSISDWPKLSSDLNTTESYFEKITKKEESVWKLYPHFEFYKKIWDDYPDHWIDSIEIFLKDKPDTRWRFKEGSKITKDPHPDPQSYCLWLNEKVRPKLGLELTKEIITKQNFWLEELEKIHTDKPDRDYMEHRFRYRIDLDHWPDGVNSKHIGF